MYENSLTGPYSTIYKQMHKLRESRPVPSFLAPDLKSCPAEPMHLTTMYFNVCIVFCNSEPTLPHSCPLSNLNSLPWSTIDGAIQKSRQKCGTTPVSSSLTRWLELHPAEPVHENNHTNNWHPSRILWMQYPLSSSFCNLHLFPWNSRYDSRNPQNQWTSRQEQCLFLHLWCKRWSSILRRQWCIKCTQAIPSRQV